MPMSFDEIAELGLAKEKSAEEFYRRWADCQKCPEKLWSRAKVLLLSLAGEEQKHQEIFAKLKAADLSMNGKDDTAELNGEDYISVSDIPSDAKTKEVIKTAIAREEAAVRFYSDLAELGGNTRGVFSNLAEQESKHKERLENFLKEHVLMDND